jgi:hypothetical protein
MNRKRILSEHFSRARERLLQYAEHIGITKHGDVKGAAREGVISIFLKENLPSLVEFKTGEILDCNDQRSGQLDIVLQSISSPRIPIFDNIQITLSDAALGVIEVKSNLTTASWDSSSHLKSALDTFRKVKNLARVTRIKAHVGDRIVEFEKTPCFLIAYKGPTKQTLVDKLLDYGRHFELSLDEYAPEVVCVLDRNYNVYRNNAWLLEPIEGSDFLFDGELVECLEGVFSYICRIVETWNVLNYTTQLKRYFDPLPESGS